MKNGLMRFGHWLIRLLEVVVMLVMAAMVLAVLWGVAARFVLRSPSNWTMEVATFLLIWLTFLGAAVGFHRWEHLGLDWFAGKLAPEAQRLLGMVSALICFLFSAAALVFGGYVLVAGTLASEQLTPALGVRMGYVYLVVPLSGVLICAMALRQAWRLTFPENLASDELRANSR